MPFRRSRNWSHEPLRHACAEAASNTGLLAGPVLDRGLSALTHVMGLHHAPWGGGAGGKLSRPAQVLLGSERVSHVWLRNE